MQFYLHALATICIRSTAVNGGGGGGSDVGCVYFSFRLAFVSSTLLLLFVSISVCVV